MVPHFSPNPGPQLWPQAPSQVPAPSLVSNPGPSPSPTLALVPPPRPGSHPPGVAAPARCQGASAVPTCCGPAACGAHGPAAVAVSPACWWTARSPAAGSPFGMSGSGPVPANRKGKGATQTLQEPRSAAAHLSRGSAIQQRADLCPSSQQLVPIVVHSCLCAATHRP